MKVLKYIAGSLIISFGAMFVLLILATASGLKTPNFITNYFFILWIVLAILILPFAKKIIRVN